MRWFAVLLVAAGLGLGSGPACADTVPYRQYTTHEGLPSKGVLSLAQTSNGLLWIGTRRGLVVCDGHEFRPISMPDSVMGKTVLALEAMPDGSVWAGIESDVVKVAPHGAARSYRLDSHNVVEILRRGEEVVFVTHQAVWKQAETGDSLARTPLQYETLQGVTQAWGADLGPQGRVWTTNGKRGPGQVRPDGTVDFADSPPSSSEYTEGKTFFDLRFVGNAVGSGSALVTRDSCLYRFDSETETFERIADAGRQLGGIRRQRQTAYLTGRVEVLRYDSEARRFQKPAGPFRDLPGTTMTAVLQGRDGGLWIGTQKEGLFHVPVPEACYVQSIDGRTVRHGMGLKNVGGSVWGTTWGDGLLQLRPRRQQAAPGGHTSWVSPWSHDGRLHGPAGTDLGGRKWYQWAPPDGVPDGGWQFVVFAEGTVRGYVDPSGVGYFWHNRGLYRHVPSGDTTRRTRLRAWPVGESQHHLMGLAPNGDLVLRDAEHLLRLRRPDGAVLDHQIRTDGVFFADLWRLGSRENGALVGVIRPPYVFGEKKRYNRGRETCQLEGPIRLFL